ncbi:MAG: MarR family transcriptional regulator [Pseudomonadota bacterium]
MTGSPPPVTALTIGLFSELVAVDQLMRARLTKALPRGMELSHFMLLNYLAVSREERSPAQLARKFHVTKPAMTNTIGRLERAGHVHVRPDWEDGRRKQVVISPAGIAARNHALDSIAPLMETAAATLGVDQIRAALPILRQLRAFLSPDAGGRPGDWDR